MLTADNLIIAAAVFAAVVLVSLPVSIWRGIAARRALARSQNELALGEEEVRILGARNTQMFNESHEKDLLQGAQEAELTNLRQRLDERGTQLKELATQKQGVDADYSRLRDELAATQTELKGQTVALEQAQKQLQQKTEELQAGRDDLAKLQGRLNITVQEYTQLQTQQEERDGQHQAQILLLNETRENLKKEFENLANKIFEDKGKSFTSTSKESLETMLKPFREQITSFQTRINEVHSESIKGNTALESEIKKVLDIGLEMNSQASNLTLALKGDKKTTGNWGEAQLERTLELAGLQNGEHYETQAAFRDDEGKRKLPDFVIKLPDSKSLVIDSKVSLVDYDRAISAATEEEQTNALNAHASAVRNHIDDLSSKDYANLPGLGSPDFVLMFMPIEPAYIEAMKHNKDLFNYGYQKGVIMVSHTTLMPILRTVANLWMVERSNREAKEISSRAGDIYNQVCLVAERLLKLGNTLRAANNHYNDSVKGLVGKQGLHGKVERFQQMSTRANKEMALLEPIHDELETERLEATTATGDLGHKPTLLDTSSTTRDKMKPITVDKKT